MKDLSQKLRELADDAEDTENHLASDCPICALANFAREAATMIEFQAHKMETLERENMSLRADINRRDV